MMDAKGLHEGQRLAIELACGKLPLLFAKFADAGDADAIGQLFTPDCEFARPFQPEFTFYGRAAVEGIFRNRPPILVRHIVTNVLVEAVSETRARGTNYLTMLSSHKSTQPPQEAGALYVGGFADEYVLDQSVPGGVWRFAKRAGMVALHLGGAMPVIPPPTDEARGLA
jgi:hypothetical protein